jgi:hypothetical protein
MSKGRSAWDEGRRAWSRLTGWHTESRVGGHSDDGDDALKALTDIGRIRQLLDQAELTAVKTARAQGKTWAEIATMLGVTRQSAWEKWRDLDAASTPEPEAARRARAEVGDDVVNELVDRGLSAPAEWNVVTVPDLIGLAWADAREVLAGAGLVPVAPETGLRGKSRPLRPIEESGWVVADQTPRGGARRAPGSSVTVWLERGGGAGVREPRRPTPTPRRARGERDEESQEAVG